MHARSKISRADLCARDTKKISRADLWMRIKEDQQSRPEPQVQLAIPLDQVTFCNGPIEPYIALNSPLKEQIKTLNVACSNLKGRLY